MQRGGYACTQGRFWNQKISMKYFREALKKVRPTISESLIEYYQKIENQFKGGAVPEEPTSYIGYR